MEAYQHEGVMESSTKMVSISLDASINVHTLHNSSFSNALVQKLIIASANPTLGLKRYLITIDSEYRIIQTRVIPVTNNEPPQSTITVRLLHSTTSETIDGNLEVLAELLPNVPSTTAVGLPNRNPRQLEPNEPIPPRSDIPVITVMSITDNSLPDRLSPIEPLNITERLYHPNEVEEVYYLGEVKQTDNNLRGTIQVEIDPPENRTTLNSIEWLPGAESNPEGQRVNEAPVVAPEQAPHNFAMYHSILRELLNRPILSDSGENLRAVDLNYNSQQYQFGSNIYRVVPTTVNQNVTFTVGLQNIQRQRQTMNVQRLNVRSPGIQSTATGSQQSILLQPRALSQLIRNSGFEQIISGANPVIAEQYLEAQNNILATGVRIASTQLLSISAIVAHDQNQYVTAYLQMLQRQPQDYLTPQQSQILEQLFFGRNIDVHRIRTDHVITGENVNRIMDIYRRLQTGNYPTYPNASGDPTGLNETVGSQLQRRLPAFNSIFPRSRRNNNTTPTTNVPGSFSQPLNQIEYYAYHQFNADANQMSTPLQRRSEDNIRFYSSELGEHPDVSAQNYQRPNPIPTVFSPGTMIDITMQLQYLQEQNYRSLLAQYNTCMSVIQAGSIPQMLGKFMYTNYRLAFGLRNLVGESDVSGSNINENDQNQIPNTTTGTSNRLNIPYIFRDLQFNEMFFFRPSNFALNYLKINQPVYEQLMSVPDNNIFCTFDINREFLDADLSAYNYVHQAQIHANNFFSNNMHLLMLDSKLFMYKFELIYATFMTYLHDVNYFGDRSESRVNDDMLSDTVLPNPFYDPSDPLSMPIVSIQQLNVMNNIPFLATLPIYKPIKMTAATSGTPKTEPNHETSETTVHNLACQETTSGSSQPGSNVPSDDDKDSLKTWIAATNSSGNRQINLPATPQQNISTTSRAVEALSTALELCDVNLDEIYTSVRLLLTSETARTDIDATLKQTINTYLTAAYNEGKKDAHLALVKSESPPGPSNPPKKIKTSEAASSTLQHENTGSTTVTQAVSSAVTQNDDSSSSIKAASDPSSSSQTTNTVTQQNSSSQQHFSAMVSQRTPKQILVTSNTSNKRIESEDRSTPESKKIKLIDLTEEEIDVKNLESIPTSTNNIQSEIATQIIPKQEPICNCSSTLSKVTDISQVASTNVNTQEIPKEESKISKTLITQSTTLHELSKIPVIVLDGALESPEAVPNQEAETNSNMSSENNTGVFILNQITGDKDNANKNVSVPSSSIPIEIKTKQENQETPEINSSPNRHTNVPISPSRGNNEGNQTNPIRHEGGAHIDTNSTQTLHTISEQDASTSNCAKRETNSPLTINPDLERMSNHEKQCNGCCKRAGIKSPIKKSHSDAQVKFQLPKTHQDHSDSPEIVVVLDTTLTSSTMPTNMQYSQPSSTTSQIASQSLALPEQLEVVELKIEPPSPLSTVILDIDTNVQTDFAVLQPTTDNYQPIQLSRNNLPENNNFQRIPEERRLSRTYIPQNNEYPSTLFSHPNNEHNNHPYNVPFELPQPVVQFRGANQDNYRNYYQGFTNVAESSHQVRPPRNVIFEYGDSYPDNSTFTSRYHELPHPEETSHLPYRQRNSMNDYDAYYPGYNNYRRYQELLNSEERYQPRNITYEYDAPHPNNHHHYYYEDERSRPRSCMSDYAATHMGNSNYRHHYQEFANPGDRPLSSQELMAYGRDYQQRPDHSRFENNDLPYYHPQPYPAEPNDNILSRQRYEMMPRSRSPLIAQHEYPRHTDPHNNPRYERQSPDSAEEYYRRRAHRHHTTGHNRRNQCRRRASRRRRHHP